MGLGIHVHQSNRAAGGGATMRFAIVGSRDYKNDQLVRSMVHWISTNFPDSIIVSGGARGVDSIAVDEASKLKLVSVVFPANWEVHGKRAGFIRNHTIVDNCDRVMAFWDYKSKGTAHTIETARKAGKRVEVFNEDGDVQVYNVAIPRPEGGE
jgi:hypothetical protein